MKNATRNVFAGVAAVCGAGLIQAAELPLGNDQPVRTAEQETRPFTVTVGAGYVGMSSCDCNGSEGNVGPGNNIHGMSQNPLTLWSLGVTVLPDTLNLSVGLGGTISSDKIEGSSAGTVRHGELKQKDDYYSVFIRPSFAVSPLGGFGLGVERLAHQKGLPGSASGAPSQPVNVVDLPNDGRNPSGFGGTSNMVLPREDSLGFDTDFTRYVVSYHLPVWDFLSVEYAREKGHRQLYRYGVESVPGTTSSAAFVSRAKYTGNRIAAGLVRDPAKLESGFSVSKLQVFQTKIKASYYDYQFGRQEELDGVHFEGLTVAFNYRWKMRGYQIDGSLSAEKRLESYPDRAGVPGYACSGCGSGEIKRTESYTAGTLSVTF